MRKICVITGTRAEYGLLYWLMKSVQDDTKLELQIVATGMHLSPEFGMTYREIEKDGFNIDRKVEMLLSADTTTAISKSTGLGMIGFADAFADLKPDIIVVLGDRFEILAASLAAFFARIPIGHIGGGEKTVGAFDDAIRHSITKMSWWHFTSTEEYQKRIVQLGENPACVFTVGGLGADSIRKSQLLSKKELSRAIAFEFGQKNLLITFHPVTLENETSKKNFQFLLDALVELSDTNIIFTAPNADTDGRVIKKMIDNFVSTHKEKTTSYTSMGRLNYHSALQFVDGVVGNSSSGLAEAPMFKIGTINIGDRQKGRIKAESVIDCNPDKKSISKAIEELYSKDFRKKLKTVKNPYVSGNATEKILNVLKTAPIPNELKKEFYDL